VGYLINNECTDPGNPPHALGNKPFVTRFKINWSDCRTGTANNLEEIGSDQQRRLP
jgi:hypothetical protein